MPVVHSHVQGKKQFEVHVDGKKVDLVVGLEDKLDDIELSRGLEPTEAAGILESLAKRHRRLTDFERTAHIESEMRRSSYASRLQIEKDIASGKIEVQHSEEHKHLGVSLSVLYREYGKSATPYLGVSLTRYIQQTYEQHSKSGELEGVEFSIKKQRLGSLTETTSKKNGLYSITEEGGKFKVEMPTLSHRDEFGVDHVLVGTSAFNTREEAERAVEQSRKRLNEEFESASLRRLLNRTKSFYWVEKTEDGQYEVTLPGLETKEGLLVGKTKMKFETWDEARDKLLESLSRREGLAIQPLFTIAPNAVENVSFTCFEDYSPVVKPLDTPERMPPEIERYVSLREHQMAEGKLSGVQTYLNTIQQPGWERQLYSFIEDYLSKEGAHLKDELRIDRLDALTPQQAAQLAVRLVADLTKYNYASLGEKGPTKADKSTALEILQEGRRMMSDPEAARNWEGNAVCRNIASSVKAVFEALKVNQGGFNFLQNTYCLYENGDEFRPRVERFGSLLWEPGHAWNSFITTNATNSAVTIVDATWTVDYSRSSKVSDLDNTLLRMEAMTRNLAKSIGDDTPEREKQLNQIQTYYTIMMDKAEGRYTGVSDDETRIHFMKKGLEVIKTTGAKPNANFIETACRLISKSPELVTRGDMEVLYESTENLPRGLYGQAMEAYLGKVSLREYSSGEFTSQNDGFQRTIVDALQRMGKLDGALEESPTFRSRVRDIMPELLGEFNPAENPADMRELMHHLSNARHLVKINFPTLRTNASTEELEDFFAKLRERLMGVNPEKAIQVLEGVDDYHLIKDCAKLYQQIR